MNRVYDAWVDPANPPARALASRPAWPIPTCAWK